MFPATGAAILSRSPVRIGVTLIPSKAVCLFVAAIAMSPGDLRAQSDSAALLPLDYQFAIDLPDSGGAIQGDARITFLRRAPADSLTLDLIGLHVQRVDVERQSRVAFRRTDSALVVPIPAGTRARFTVRVIYHG